MSGHRRITLSIEKKFEVLEALKWKSTINVAKEFGIGHSTVKKIRQNEDKIRKIMLVNGNVDRKRNRPSPNEEIAEALIAWFHDASSRNELINGPKMLDKAKQLAITLGYGDFKPSHGWLERLKARNNIHFPRSSKSRRPDSDKDEPDWITNVLPMIKGYDPNDVFNADETVLFYKATPSGSFTGNHPCKITPKDRLTVLFLCNSTGTEKDAYAVGNLPNPSCFENEGTPLPYYSSTNAVMTPWIWLDILQKFDQNLGNRKVILFVDNEDCHKTKMELKNIKLMFMPLNASSNVQPLNQGIIRMVKIHYRAYLMKKKMDALNRGTLVTDFSKTIDVLEGLHMLKTAWLSINGSSIARCFQKAGFPVAVITANNMTNISNETAELKDTLQEDFEAFVDCDKDINCFTDSKVCDLRTALDREDIDVDKDEFQEQGNGETVSRVSHQDALNALSVVRRYLEENFTDYNAYYEVEEMIKLNAYADDQYQIIE